MPHRWTQPRESVSPRSTTVRWRSCPERCPRIFFEELASLALPFEEGEIPSESELRIAKAQLVGWLEGLFHGIQATLMAQQFAAQRQLQEMRQLPGSQQMPQQHSQESGPDRPGTYL